MAKTIFVSRAQKRAAQTLVARGAITGRFVSPAVVKIAKAQRANGRSAVGESPEASTK